MKKYIYYLLLFISGTLIYGQNTSRITYETISGFTTKTESEISLVKMELQEVKEISKIGCGSDLGVIQCGCVGNTSYCRENCTVFINGVKIRPFNCFEPNEITNNNHDKSNSDQSTGLEGHNFIEDPAIIYPNPVKDIMNIKSIDPITVIEILNLHGEVEQTMNPQKEKLDVSNLPAGIYYVRISFENRKTVQVEKIVIVK